MDEMIKAYWDEDLLLPLPADFEAKAKAIIAKGGGRLYEAWMDAGFPWPFHYTEIFESA